MSRAKLIPVVALLLVPLLVHATPTRLTSTPTQHARNAAFETSSDDDGEIYHRPAEPLLQDLSDLGLVEPSIGSDLMFGDSQLPSDRVRNTWEINDIDNDATPDLLILTVDGNVYAMSGSDLSMIWISCLRALFHELNYVQVGGDEWLLMHDFYGNILFVDPETGDVERQFHAAEGIADVHFASEGTMESTHVAVAFRNGSTAVFDMDGQLEWYKHESYVVEAIAIKIVENTDENLMVITLLRNFVISYWLTSGGLHWVTQRDHVRTELHVFRDLDLAPQEHPSLYFVSGSDDSVTSLRLTDGQTNWEHETLSTLIRMEQTSFFVDNELLLVSRNGWQMINGEDCAELIGRDVEFQEIAAVSPAPDFHTYGNGLLFTFINGSLAHYSFTLSTWSWSVHVDDYVLVSVILFEDDVIVGTQHGNIYRIDPPTSTITLATQALQRVQQIILADADTNGVAQTIISSSVTGEIQIRSTDDGSLNWELQTLPGASCLLIEDDLGEETLVVQMNNGSMRGYDPQTGNQQWNVSYEATLQMFAVPSISAKTSPTSVDFFVISTTAYEYKAIDTDGQIMWNGYLSGQTAVSVAFAETDGSAGRELLFGTTSGQLIWIDETNGAIIDYHGALPASIRFICPFQSAENQGIEDVVTAALSGDISMYDSETDLVTWHTLGMDRSVGGVAILHSDDSEDRIALLHSSLYVVFVDPSTGQELDTVNIHEFGVSLAVADLDGDSREDLIIGGIGGDIVIINHQSNERLYSTAVAQHSLSQIAIDAIGTTNPRAFVTDGRSVRKLDLSLLPFPAVEHVESSFADPELAVSWTTVPTSGVRYAVLVSYGIMDDFEYQDAQLAHPTLLDENTNSVVVVPHDVWRYYTIVTVSTSNVANINGNGMSSLQQPADTTDVSPPQQVPSVSAGRDGDTVTIVWQPSPETGVSYNVYRCSKRVAEVLTTSSSVALLREILPDASLSTTDNPGEGKWYYVVTALDTVGNENTTVYNNISPSVSIGGDSEGRVIDFMFLPMVVALAAVVIVRLGAKPASGKI